MSNNGNNIMLVNNTGLDLTGLGFDKVIIEVIRERAELPEEIADLFVLEIIEVDGQTRGILNMA